MFPELASYLTIKKRSSIPNTSNHMDKKIFNPLEWLDQPTQQKIATHTPEVEHKIESEEIIF